MTEDEKIIQLVPLTYPLYAVYDEWHEDGSPGYERIVMAGLRKDGIPVPLSFDCGSGYWDEDQCTTRLYYVVGEMPDDWIIRAKKEAKEQALSRAESLIWAEQRAAEQRAAERAKKDPK